MITTLRYILFLSCLTFIVSCGEGVGVGEDYGDLLQSPEGLTLTQAEHEVGWEREDCTTCHNLENIHLVNRSTLPLDIEAIHDRALTDGESGCVDCHGSNGVP